MISERIHHLIQLVPAAERVIDVGADHGLVSIGLAERDDIGAVLATDISADSLSKLRASLCRAPHRVQEKVELAVADGLQALPWSQADVIVIAGMGGPLMQHIITGGRRIFDPALWVLSPQSGIPEFRHFLQNWGVEIEESALREGSIDYAFFLVHGDRERRREDPYWRPLDELAAEYGPQLIASRDPVTGKRMRRDLEALRGLRRRLGSLDSPSAQRRMEFLDRRIRLLTIALSDWPWKGAEDADF